MAAFGGTHLNIDLSSHPPLEEQLSHSDSDAESYIKPQI